MPDPCLPMRKKLDKLHNDDGLSWRAIAALPQFKGTVAAGTLCSFAKGNYEPKDNVIRRALELPVYEKILVRRNSKGRFSKRSGR